jgi:hypothetical protein
VVNDVAARSCTALTTRLAMTTARATYTLPEGRDFHAGAFDLDRFQVYDTCSTVTFRVQTGPHPTFGSTKRRAAGGCLRVANPAPCPPPGRRPTRDELFDYHPWSQLIGRASVTTGSWMPRLVSRRG